LRESDIWCSIAIVDGNCRAPTRKPLRFAMDSESNSQSFEAAITERRGGGKGGEGRGGEGRGGVGRGIVVTGRRNIKV
jgi:hypothetical protein